jgi:hypothetical protein
MNILYLARTEGGRQGLQYLLEKGVRLATASEVKKLMVK